MKKEFKRTTGLLALAMGCAFAPTDAHATLNIFMYDNAGQLTIESQGTLNLGTSQGTTGCDNSTVEANLFVNFSTFSMCPTPNDIKPAYPITFVSGANTWGTAAPITGFFGTITSGRDASFDIDAQINNFSTNVSSGGTIHSVSSFSGKSIADLGLAGGSGPRLLAQYKITETNDLINIYAETEPNNVPGPLPVLGAAGALGWSRQLRRRIAQRQMRG